MRNLPQLDRRQINQLEHQRTNELLDHMRRVKEGTIKDQGYWLQETIKNLYNIENIIILPGRRNVTPQIKQFMHSFDMLISDLNIRTATQRDTIFGTFLKVYGSFNEALNKHEKMVRDSGSIGPEHMQRLYVLCRQVTELGNLVNRINPQIGLAICNYESTNALRQELIVGCEHIYLNTDTPISYTPWTVKIRNKEVYDWIRAYESPNSTITQTVYTSDGKLWLIPIFKPKDNSVEIYRKLPEFNLDVNATPSRSTLPSGGTMNIRTILNFSCNEDYLGSFDIIDTTFISPIIRSIGVFMNFVRYWLF